MTDKITSTPIGDGDIWSTNSTGCLHIGAEPVTLLADGETVAYLCPFCDAKLPARFGDTLAQRQEFQARRNACEHENNTDFTDWLGHVIARRCDGCGKHLPLE